MADPLNLLRQYNISQKKIIERDSQIIFGEFSFPKNVKTNYLMSELKKDDTLKEYYTLECLLFLLKNATFTHSIYVKKAIAENIPVVRRPDRKDLLTYLNGETAEFDAIDKSTPLEIATEMKRTAEDIHGSVAKKPRIEGTQMQKVKEQLDARRDAPKLNPATLDNIKSLSDALSDENIAAIKTKRLVKKRTTIKGNDDIGMGSDLRVKLDFDVDSSKHIISRERQGRTRNTILQSSGKMFDKNIFAILQSIENREEGRHRPPQPTPTITPIRVMPQPAVYNRYDQEHFNRQKEETEGFKIDTMSTFHGMTLKSVTEGSRPCKMPPPRGMPVAPSSPPSTPRSTSEARLLLQGNNKRVSRTPIIIIPGAYTSLITMYNVKEVLQDLRYISTEAKKSQGYKRENEILLQRRKEGALTVPYRVIDNPQKLSTSDWERVVAVFVMGPAWQFKGWPWNANPVEIFSKICAFHVKFDEMKLESNVARWAVHVIELSRTKRYLDRAALMVFWEKLDNHMIKNKPHLRF